MTDTLKEENPKVLEKDGEISSLMESMKLLRESDADVAKKLQVVGESLWTLQQSTIELRKELVKFLIIVVVFLGISVLVSISLFSKTF